MLDHIINNDIDLPLVKKSFIPEYVALVKKDYNYLSEWLEWPTVCVTKEDFGKFFADSISSYESDKTFHGAIRYKGTIAGLAGYNTIDFRLKRVEIGYWLGQDFQGKGIITKVCKHLINYAFEELKMQKVQISIATGNLKSRAVCERLGMKLEGIVTNEEKVGDRILDHAIYGIHREKT
jgi:ribosomal-protein-serine acetyltransferase